MACEIESYGPTHGRHLSHERHGENTRPLGMGQIDIPLLNTLDFSIRIEYRLWA